MMQSRTNVCSETGNDGVDGDGCECVDFVELVMVLAFAYISPYIPILFQFSTPTPTLLVKAKTSSSLSITSPKTPAGGALVD